VKIPQLAIRDTTGRDYPAYFNIWQWITPQLTPAERGGKKGSPSDCDVGRTMAARSRKRF